MPAGAGKDVNLSQRFLLVASVFLTLKETIGCPA
jgi:hypothetical protein